MAIERVEVISIDDKLKTGLALVRDECQRNCAEETEKQLTNTRKVLIDRIEDRTRELSVEIAEADSSIKLVQTELSRTGEATKRNLESIDTLTTRHRESVAAIAVINDRLDRLGNNLASAKTRLDGDLTGQVKSPSIELMRQTQERHEAQISGTNGGVPLASMADKFRELNTILTLLKFLGGGGVAAFLASYIGYSQPKGLSLEDARTAIVIQQQRKEIDELRSEVAALVKQVYSSKPK